MGGEKGRVSLFQVRWKHRVREEDREHKYHSLGGWMSNGEWSRVVVAGELDRFRSSAGFRV